MGIDTALAKCSAIYRRVIDRAFAGQSPGRETSENLTDSMKRHRAGKSRVIFARATSFCRRAEGFAPRLMSFVRNAAVARQNPTENFILTPKGKSVDRLLTEALL